VGDLEAPDGEVTRWCTAGHSFSAESMLELQSDSVETALWTSCACSRSGPTRCAGSRTTSARAATSSGAGFELRAREVSDRAEVLRHAIARSHGVAAPVDKADVTT
jgi:hypothetical protein